MEAKVLEINGAESEVSAVTVFNDRAEVTRKICFEAEEAGRYDVCVSRLSGKVCDQSVRVAGGKGGATLLEAIVKDVVEKGVEEEAVQEKRAALMALQEALEDVRAEEAAIETTRGWMGTVANSMAAMPSKGENKFVADLPANGIENIRKFAEFYRADMVAQQKALNALQKRREEILEQIKAVTATLNGLERKPAVRTKTVKVSFVVKKAGKITFLLSYVLPGASWNARYTAHFTSENENFEFTYFGVVCNKTGEAWKETEITLSTAQPAIGGVPEPLPPVSVGFYYPPQRMCKAKKGAGLMARRRMDSEPVADMVMDDAMPEEEEMDVLVASAAESALGTVTYTIPVKTTILSDGEDHKLTIALVRTDDTKLVRVVRPRTNAFAFIKAKLVNKSEYTFIPGQCDVFVDGNLVSTSEMGNVAPGEMFGFYLGPDKSLRVTYRPPFKKRGEAGWVMKSNQEAYDGEISIKNPTKKAVEVVVSESVPRSNDSQISVTVQQPNLKTKEAVLTKKNQLKWRFVLEAGKSRDLAVKYVIDFPKDRSVVVQ